MKKRVRTTEKGVQTLFAAVQMVFAAVQMVFAAVQMVFAAVQMTFAAVQTTEEPVPKTKKAVVSLQGPGRRRERSMECPYAFLVIELAHSCSCRKVMNWKLTSLLSPAG
jgi:hypothetical protein